MAADAIFPEAGSQSFAVLENISVGTLLVVILLISAGIASWKVYRDFIVAPKKLELAISTPPLSQLDDHGFVFDGDYFKKAERGYIVLIAYYWVDAMKPKGNYVVGVLFNHEHEDQVKRQEKSAALQDKYAERVPPILFFENFAYRLFPQTDAEPIDAERLLDFKDHVLQILGYETEPTFSDAQLEEAMAKNVREVFADLDGLI